MTRKTFRLAIAPLVAGASTLAFAGGEKLASESSQFLRAHAADAIDWQPWGDAAWAQAKTQQKPVYVFLGAYTNELSRAMQKQSFVNPQIIAALNRDCVCVIVDRDEHPELGNVFQLYLQANKQVHGWPANLWLTPDLKPFDGAAYLPPSEEWGKEGILNYVKRIEGEWKDGRDQLADKTDEALSNLRSLDLTDPPPPFSANGSSASLKAAADAWLQSYDSAHASFGDSPHYLDPELIRFLLRTPGPARDAGIAVLHTLDRSVIHDPLDGGFFRRSVDAGWQFPSFQKTASDQARLALAYLDAAQITSDASLSRAARSALDYLLTRLATRDGAFNRGEDATLDETTAGFGWTQAEIAAALGEKDAAAFDAAFAVKPEGNVTAENDAAGKWKGKNLLYRPSVDDDERFAPAKAKLLALRDQRARPLRDEHIAVLDNGLAIAALARAGRELHEPRYIAAATKAAEYVNAHARDHGELLHLATLPFPATPDDYAAFTLGLAALSKNSDAVALLDTERKMFFDDKLGHFFMQSANVPPLWLRAHAIEPGAGEGMTVESLTILAYVSAGKRDAIPPTLLAAVASTTKETSPLPRGDALLATSLAIDPK